MGTVGTIIIAVLTVLIIALVVALNNIIVKYEALKEYVHELEEENAADLSTAFLNDLIDEIKKANNKNSSLH